MDRRSFLKGTLALPFTPGAAWAQAAPTNPGVSRVRPGQPGWPSKASWDSLDRSVAGRLVKVLQKAGFTVREGISGMPTAFVAECGKGKPIIGILAEYDALPELSQEVGWELSEE